PTFLEPEYPFEWTGVYSLDSGRYELSLAEGPDPEMSLVVVSDQGTDDAALREGAEWCVRRYAEPAELIRPGEAIPAGKHVNLQLDSPGRKSFFLEVGSKVRLGLYAQHTAEEFDLQLKNAEGVAIREEVERTWVAQHEHDDEVGSIAIEIDGDVDPEKLNTWLGKLLGERGVDIFRMKGFISLAGESRRFVFQGVHMLFDSQPDRPWGDSPRRNQLVFIGRNLDEEGMRRGFEECLI
ncbi:MAG: GTP-binding protein, partial [Gammaproteobacteria bacterium]|nr:GTP-binding protein [Gammaproteobacteria bacterium]